MNPLKEFDFSCLDDPAFREDAVREEMIAPILRALGLPSPRSISRGAQQEPQTSVHYGRIA